MAARIAVAAMLCQALVPVYAMAALGTPQRLGVPVCTGLGVVWVTFGSDGRPVKGQEPATKARACPFCVVQTTPFTPPQGTAIAQPPPRPVAVVAGPNTHLVFREPAPTPRLTRAPPWLL